MINFPSMTAETHQLHIPQMKDGIVLAFAGATAPVTADRPTLVCRGYRITSGWRNSS